MESHMRPKDIRQTPKFLRAWYNGKLSRANARAASVSSSGYHTEHKNPKEK